MTPLGRFVAAFLLQSVAAAAAAVAVPARADIDGAVADFKTGRYLEAAAELQAIVDREPAYAYGHFLLGHCMLKMKRPAEAEIDFRRAVALDGSRPEFYLGWALALRARGEWARSIQAATEGLARARDAKERYALLALRGSGWSALGRWPEAAHDLEAARGLRSEPWACLLLGRAYAALSAFDEAIPPLQDALGGAPDDPSILRLLAASLLNVAATETDPARKASLYAQAVVVAQRLSAARPDEVEAIQLVGRARLGAGQPEVAEGLFQRVIALDPHPCYALVDLGRVYIALERWADAETALRRASACAPRLAVVYETIGDLYLRRGMTREAAAAFRRADDIEPRAAHSPRPAQRRETPATLPVTAPK